MARIDRHLFAIGVPFDPRDLVGTLAPNTSGAVTSSYTEEGGRPGRVTSDDGTSRCRPVITGTQTSNLELATVVGGQPQISRVGALQMAWRLDGDAAGDWRGWAPPNWLHTWITAKWTASGAGWAGQCVAIEPTQKVAITYDDGGSRIVRVYDPATAAWTSEITVRTTADASDTIVCTRGGRLICTAANRAYRSDDDGSTWTLHSSGVIGDEVDWQDYELPRAAWGADGSVLYVAQSEADPDILLQLASDDGMSTLRLVEEDTYGPTPSVVAMPGGGYVVGYISTADDKIRVRRLSSAFQPLSEATAILVDSDDATQMTLTADPDGLLWCHWCPKPHAGSVFVSVSTDYGATWLRLDEGLMQSIGTSDAPMINMASCSVASAVFVLHNSSPTTSTTGNSLGLAHCGGWTNLPPSIPGWSAARDWTARSGTGAGGSGDNATWIPVELPGDNGWTKAGAGSESIGLPGILTLVSAANTISYERNSGASNEPSVALFELRTASGGQLGQNDIAFRKWVSNASNERAIAVRFSATGIRCYDEKAAAALGTDATVDTTEDVQVLVLVSPDASVDSGVWYRRAYDTAWTEIWTGTLQNDTVTMTGTSGCKWGHLNTGTATSRWIWVADSESSRVGQGLSHPAAVGRPIGQRPIPLPREAARGVTEYGTGGTAYLSVLSGPGALGETFAADAEHDYPVEACIPTVSPSPARKWRSTSTDEQIIAWDFDDEVWGGDTFGLLILGANFYEAYLEYHDGGSWQTAVSFDNRATVEYLLDGYAIRPSGSTPDGDRYYQEGEFRGGYMLIPAGAGDVSRPIVHNAAGWWAPGTAGPEARIQIEDADGSEDSSGTGAIVPPRGLAVGHPGQYIVARRWRVRIPASQIVANPYYEAGVIYPVALRTLGAAPDWGWSQETVPNAETSRNRYGTTRTTKLGPPVTSWSFGWTDGVDLSRLRVDTSADADYLGHANGYAPGGTAAEDVPWLLRGLLELTDSGAVPVVALATLPADGTVTDPTLFLYGRLTGSVRSDHMVGAEGEDEAVRVAAITIEGIV